MSTLNTIQEAYSSIITEKVDSKFKVGDKVGIGGNQNFDPLNYKPIDTGTITKTAAGIHTVEFDNRKEPSYFPSEASKPLTHKFNSAGKSMTDSSALICPMADHEKRIATHKENVERRSDIEAITRQLEGMKNGFGNYPKLAKHHGEAIKALLDKHTEE